MCPKQRTVVVAQLAEHSFPIPEAWSLNQVISKKIVNKSNVYFCKDENKEKVAGNDPYKKNECVSAAPFLTTYLHDKD